MRGSGPASGRLVVTGPAFPREGKSAKTKGSQGGSNEFTSAFACLGNERRVNRHLCLLNTMNSPNLHPNRAILQLYWAGGGGFGPRPCGPGHRASASDPYIRPQPSHMVEQDSGYRQLKNGMVTKAGVLVLVLKRAF